MPNKIQQAQVRKDTAMKDYDFTDKVEWITEVEETNIIRKKAPWKMAYLMLWGIENLCSDKSEVADLYDETSEQLEVARKTLQNYVSVARRFEPQDIHERLEIGHHVVVVALPDEMAEYWLSRAEANAWSVQRLRAEIKAAAETPNEDEGDDDDAFVRTQAVELLKGCGITAITDEDLLTMQLPGGRVIQIAGKGNLQWSLA